MTKRYFHVRNVDYFATHNRMVGDGSWCHPHGGITFVVEKAADDFVTVAHSECSLKDNFCRKTGRSFADTRPPTPCRIDNLPKVMADIVSRSKRITNPSVTDFDFTTKYFKD